MTTFSKHFSHFSGLIGRFAALSCWILFLVSSASCSSQGKPMPDLAAEINATLDPEWSRFLSGDNVVLRFAHDPNLDQTVLVDGNGYASFLLIGPLRVAGKTLAQLTDELNGAYGPKLNAPDLTINRMLPEAATTGVVGERAIYVMGEVLVPGSQAFEGQRLTLVQAIARAGGPDKRSALLQDSLLVRWMPEQGVWKAWRIDARPTYWSSPKQILLQVHDLIYVPNTTIDVLNIWVDKYIRQMIPFPYLIPPVN